MARYSPEQGIIERDCQPQEMAGELFGRIIPREGIHLAIGPGCTIFDDASLLMHLSRTGNDQSGSSRVIIIDPNETGEQRNPEKGILGSGKVIVHRRQLEILRMFMPLSMEEYLRPEFSCFSMPIDFTGKVTSISDHNVLGYLVNEVHAYRTMNMRKTQAFMLAVTQYRQMLADGGVLFLQSRSDTYLDEDQSGDTCESTTFAEVLHQAGFSRVDRYRVNDTWKIPVPFDLEQQLSELDGNDTALYNLNKHVPKRMVYKNDQAFLVIRPKDGSFRHDSPHLLVAVA